MEIVELTSDAELHEGYAVMHELRTQLDETAYFALLADMIPAGYRQFAVREDGRIVAMAGIGFGVNFYYGHYIWVYDLITTAACRSQGYGQALLEHIEELGRVAGCDTLALASGVQRLDAHRFYEQRMKYNKLSYNYVKTLKLSQRGGQMAVDFLAAQLEETWAINNRLNLYLLEAIPDEHLGLRLARGRSVGEMFAHIHNIRLSRIEYGAKELMATLAKLEKEQAGDKEQLRAALGKSAPAISQLINMAVANGGKVKNYKPHVTAFVGYFIAHEAHHRAEITFVLTETHHKLDDTVMYSLWDWSKRQQEL